MGLPLVPTPHIEALIDEAATKGRSTEGALDELRRLKVVQCQLEHHIKATRMQTEASIANVVSVANAPEAPKEMPRLAIKD